MPVSLQYKTKKALINAIGKQLLYQETSIFGDELKINAEGKSQIVTGANYGTYPNFDHPASWYAQVTVRISNGSPIIIGVK
jgi:hypothetical protein